MTTTTIPSRVIDITGQKYGQLTVIEYQGKNKRNDAIWLCQCDCGTRKTISAGSLRNSHTLSCGCLPKKLATKHNLCYSRTYHIWQSMKARCLNPKSKDYPRYGARGIHICERWLNFNYFLEDMGKCPENMSIDRINNSGDYVPENCRWASSKTQANNRRNNFILEFKGESKTLSQWSDITKISPGVLSYRIKHNWSTEEALTIPPRKTIPRKLIK